MIARGSITSSATTDRNEESSNMPQPNLIDLSEYFSEVVIINSISMLIMIY